MISNDRPDCQAKHGSCDSNLAWHSHGPLFATVWRVDPEQCQSQSRCPSLDRNSYIVGRSSCQTMSEHVGLSMQTLAIQPSQESMLNSSIL